MEYLHVNDTKIGWNIGVRFFYNDLKGEYGKKISIKGKKQLFEGFWGRTRGGGVGGFESGGENNTITLEYRVVSKSPHSQGELNLKFKFKKKTFLYFYLKKIAHMLCCIVISDIERIRVAYVPKTQ